MEALGQYILSVTAAAVVCALIKGLSSSGSYSAVVNLLCGIFLSVTILSPLDRLNMDEWFLAFQQNFLQTGEDISAEGTEQRTETLSAIIKEQTEAYILDKAAQWHSELQVTVYLSEDALPVPVMAELRGSVSPYAKLRLSKMLEDDLGISKENQQWIG